MQNNKVYAYCRVSTYSQSLERQIIAVKEYAKANGLTIDDRDIIQDTASGKNFERDGYRLLTEKLLRPGDYLIVKELDRFGRNYEEIRSQWRKLCDMGINLIIIDTPLLNTAEKSSLERDLISNIIFELLSYVAASERNKILQRQKEGIAAAKGRGVHFGRPAIKIPDNFAEVLAKWKGGEITTKKAMMVTNLSHSSFYRLVAKYKY